MKLVPFNRAFTLIELLVVIAIVGILSGLVFVSMSGAIDAAKDAKRKTDLSAIQKALTMYQSSNGSYPILASCTIGSSCLETELASYIADLPIDSDATKHYTYSSDGTDFTLSATLSTGSTYTFNSTSGWAESSSPFVGWTYKKLVTLSSTLTQDYQIKLTIPFGSGGCESNCNADFSDLRFAATNGTVLSYWIESYTASTTATVWVKALNNSSSFYMYYKNTGATTTANGDNTFEFFDDFNGGSLDLTKWREDTSNFTVSGGILSNTTNGVELWSNAVITTSTNSYAMRTRSLISSNDNQIGLAHYVDYSPRAEIIQWTSSGAKFLGTTGWSAAGKYSLGAYHVFDILLIPNSTCVYKVDGTVSETQNYSSPGDMSIVASVGASGTTTSDWVLLRKYQSVEPTPSFGAEQSN
ncbi:MAG: DUF2341 domain-containing protein [Candidatus Paceibacterota bacterium]|jgi:prepilin-type N-terminal cleavage/methylation domain-containing protein